MVKRCTINQYADDTTIYASSKDSREVGSALEEDLERISNWISANGLVMNIAKTQLMVLSRRGRQAKEKVNVRVDEVDLPQQEHVKLLGVVVDYELKWKQQIDCVRRKSLACLANIRRAGRYLPSHIRKLLYTSMVLPHLDYCSVVWNDCNAGLCNRVERVQNYAMRIILGKPPLTNSESLRTTLGWSTLKTRRRNAMLAQVQRCINGRAPAYLKTKFSFNSDNGYNCTRGASKLHVKQPQSSYYHSSFEFQGALVYNRLPQAVRTLTEPRAFRRQITQLNLK